MGFFSFIKSDEGVNLQYGGLAKLLCPDGNHISGMYDGYGRIKGFDVYYLFAIWNRKQIIQLGIGSNSQNQIIKAFFNENISISQVEENYGYEAVEDVIRNLGIDLYFSEIEPQFPLKIVSFDCKLNYEEALPSEDDPTQGLGVYDVLKGEFLGYCSHCGAEVWENNSFCSNGDEYFCDSNCYENFYYEEDEE